MSTLFPDTTPEVERVLIELLRRRLADILLGPELAEKAHGRLVPPQDGGGR